MTQKKPELSQSVPQSPRHRHAALKNLQKAWQASRSRWEFTPARRRASLRTIRQAQLANRKPGRTLSPAQHEAVRRNLAKARETLGLTTRS